MGSTQLDLLYFLQKRVRGTTINWKSVVKNRMNERQIKENIVQAKQWLDKCYLNSASSPTVVKRCHADLKCGRRDTNDAERSVRQNSAVVP
ncbi:hypothetical protein TNCV_4640061 [Trichonephila clavipes]|nr:hypothetical protein TNCV_4640061 [Trichonephila clavipes]